MPFSPPGDPPDPGIGPRCPALASRFFTTEPPGKSTFNSKQNFSSFILGGNWQAYSKMQVTRTMNTRKGDRENKLETLLYWLKNRQLDHWNKMESSEAST